jgi:2'-5' RNA ligase
MAAAAGTRRRLFVAVPLPGNVVPFVLRAQETLPRAPDLRLLKPEQFHFTLVFIGEADDGMTAAALAVVEGLPVESGGEALMENLLLLPHPKRARVVALGVVDEAAVFSRLFAAVVDGLEAVKVARRESRPFFPHLTIARLKRPRPLLPMYDCGRTRFGIESVCLYESKLRREGAEYTVLTRTDLKMSKGQEIA